MSAIIDDAPMLAKLIRAAENWGNKLVSLNSGGFLMWRIAIIVLAGWLAMAGPALAGAFEDGLKAYEGKKFKPAAELYRQAAEKGHPVAQLKLGGMYEDGVGVAEDLKSAAGWYLKAAEQGNGAAQLRLGAMYAGG